MHIGPQSIRRNLPVGQLTADRPPSSDLLFPASAARFVFLDGSRVSEGLVRVSLAFVSVYR